jgi:riboflavin-specific deaminase-like protein
MFVFTNLATSIDGKIAARDRGTFLLGTPEDRRLMQVLRAQSDVVLFGASTLRTHRKPCIVRGPAANGLAQQPANAVVSTRLAGVNPGWAFFRAPGFRRILFVDAKTAKTRDLARFERTCEIVPLRKPGGPSIVRALEARGFRRLLVEGGGEVMWDFVGHDLVDEFYVTLTPWAIGGREAPTMIDGRGFSSRKALPLKLKDCRRVGDELYLVYGRR